MRNSFITRIAALFTALTLAVSACGPQPTPPPSDGGIPVVTPSDWTRSAQVAVTVGRGLIAVARPVVATLAQEPGRTRADRAFVAADQALVVLNNAVDAYRNRGGDRCVAYAASGAAVFAFRELATVLVDNGIALGVPIGRVVDVVASISDTLVPSCDRGVLFASVGMGFNADIRSLEAAAGRRGVSLNRSLDRIEPALVDAGR